MAIAQVGCGYWGRNLARNFAELGVLVGVVDGDPAVAERISAATAAPVRSLEEVLADPMIDGISLATPAVSHSSLALRAIAAGKHVFIEKPLALTPDDAERVVAAAAATDRVLMVGHLLRYHPIFLALQKLVESGALGRLRYIYSNRLSLGKFRTEEDVLWSFAPHDLSMVLALADAMPDRVSAQGASFVTDGIVDWCTCQLGFPSGLSGHIQVSWAHPFKEQRLVVVGDEAMAVFEDSEPEWGRRLALYRHRIDCNGPVPVPDKAEAEFVMVPRAEPLRSECEHFIMSIVSGVTPRTDGEEGLRVLKVLDRARRDLMQMRPVA
ncbi:Gfo/Idh/MocA family protein [Sphingosinicella humi]|uniref:Gfo/Idh/MocA family protein n=1 Tax=Allosphingosinicella humi TaxID=2068657 RepID=UPI001A9C511E|nr:Gfo/Idh/MocA family oxidoreductase [Sphingosinicella humi]